MNKEKIVEKIKHFWDDSEAISPVVATILVLAVAVATGVGLYVWVVEFQEGAQAEVEDSTTGQMEAMSIGSANLVVTALSDSLNFKGMDSRSDREYGDPNEINPNGSNHIYYATMHYDPVRDGGPNGVNKEGWNDERFVVEIPIIISSNADLTGVELAALKPVPKTGTLWDSKWLHLNKDNDYQLLNGDGTAFKGFINESTDKVYPDDGGLTYHFGGTSHLGLNITGATMNTAEGTCSEDIYYPAISETDNSTTVMRFYTGDGQVYNAIAKKSVQGTVTDVGWVTCDFRDKAETDSYFKGDKLAVFDNPTYEVADITANHAVTAYAYLYIGVLNLDEGYAEIELPFRVTTEEGVTGTTSATLIISPSSWG